MGLRDRRQLPGQHPRRGGPAVHRRRLGRRPVVLPRRATALDPGARGRRRVPARVRQRRLLRERDVPDHRLVQPHPARRAGEELRGAESAFDDLPTDIGHTRYMFAGDVPPALVDDAPPYPATQPPRSYTWHMHAQEPTKAPGGQVRITDSRNFTVSSGSRRRWSRSSRAGCASCTGTPTPTSGSTTCGAGPDDGVRLRRQGPHVRLPGRRRRLRPLRHGPLRREHRRRDAHLPGDVPQRPLRRRLAEPVDGVRRPSWSRPTSTSTTTTIAALPKTKPIVVR